MTPTELILKPGESIALTAKAFDASGVAIALPGPATWTVENLKGTIAEGKFTADAAAGAQAGIVKATVGTIVGAARIRVIPDLPWSFDFEDGSAVPPPQWANATNKFAVRDLEGNKVLVKLAENDFAFAKRCRPFFGSPDLSNYTIEADIRAMERRRQMGDIGVVAQRYELVVFGNHQELHLQPWQPETHAHGEDALQVRQGRLVHDEARSAVARRRQSARARQGLAEGPARTSRRGRSSASIRLAATREAPGSTQMRRRASAAARSSTTTTSRFTRTSNCSSRVAPRRFGARLATRARITHTSCPRCSHAPWRPSASLFGLLSISTLGLIARSDPGKGDWPMWGGTPDRNLVSSMKDLPTSWDIKTKKNIKWVAELGSQAYGNPVVANGVVLVGTNNESMKDPAVKGDKGVLMAFKESDGSFLWQAVHDKLTAGRANDWPFQGICSSPLVENGIAYYVSNRGEVMAVDIQGFRDNGENDGPFKDEKQTRETDVDIIWRYDMMDELGVFQHNMANSSPVRSRT